MRTESVPRRFRLKHRSSTPTSRLDAASSKGTRNETLDTPSGLHRGELRPVRTARLYDLMAWQHLGLWRRQMDAAGHPGAARRRRRDRLHELAVGRKRRRDRGVSQWRSPCRRRCDPRMGRSGRRRRDVQRRVSLRGDVDRQSERRPHRRGLSAEWLYLVRHHAPVDRQHRAGRAVRGRRGQQRECVEEQLSDRRYGTRRHRCRHSRTGRE